MTRTSTGPLDDSSLRPSWSCSAVKSDSPTSDGLSLATLEGSAVNDSGLHWRSQSKLPASAVRSNTRRSVQFDKLVTSVENIDARPARCPCLEKPPPHGSGAFGPPGAVEAAALGTLAVAAQSAASNGRNCGPS